MLQVLLSLQMQIPASMFRQHVRRHSYACWQMLTTAMLCATAVLTLMVSIQFMVTFALSILVIQLIGPVWLVFAHKAKVQVSGPWIEAVPMA